jgi:hypothetical protein
MTDDILTDAQRRDLADYAGVSAGPALDDAALLGAAAERIGLEGEMAVDPDGLIELERGDLLVILEAVAGEDAQYVDRPDLLHLGVYVKADSAGRRAELEAAGLLEPADADGAQEVEGGWVLAWWGTSATTLPRDAPLPAQMEAMHRVMNSSEAVLERGAIGPFFDELDGFLLDEDAGPDED